MASWWTNPRDAGATARLEAADGCQEQDPGVVFETYKERFTRAMICTQDPRKSNVRDLAIAQKAFTGYGYDAPTPPS